MPRVIGIDPGTVSIDLCGLEDGELRLDHSLPTYDAVHDPAALLHLLTKMGRPDFIAGPSGYGLPLIPAAEATEDDLRLAFLAGDEETGGIGGLRRLARVLATSGLPITYTPGVVHLPTVPEYRKLNRVDLGTADKVAAATLGVWDQVRRLGGAPSDSSFILLELGGAFSAAIAVSEGAIVDGLGGTAGPVGWHSGGAWDGEVAFLAGQVTKEMLFRGGAGGLGEPGIAAYAEGAVKAVLSLTTALRSPREILLSGRRASDPAVRAAILPRLGAIAPAIDLVGFARIAKQGAQGAALLADGLAGGRQAELVRCLGIREARGTCLDYLRVISPEDARRRLGIL
jgi:predicted butyrate kinase (DUF1464 family)